MSQSIPMSDPRRWATTREIMQQPAVWRAFAPAIAAEAPALRAWIAARKPDEIWLCGAGTSAFIGETLAAHLNGAPGPARFRAIASTDLVAAPYAYIRDGVRPLVVSFGRSGDSPESVGTLDLLDKAAPAADWLHITCNGDGALARRPHPGPGALRVLELPAATNDTGFAMTSSYTTMLLAALAVFDAAPPAPVADCFNRLAAAAERLIAEGFATFSRYAPPSRAVFLGSGPLKGSARESALKVLELTAGQVPAFWDSTLGFRHGPKAIVDVDTLVTVFESGNAFTRNYDVDLAREIAAQFGAKAVLRLGEASGGADIDIPSIGSDGWSSVLHVIVAQILAVLWADRLGSTVDDPFAGRNLTRVVSGVTLYDFPMTRR